MRGAALRNWECPAAPLARRSCRSRRFFRTCGAPPSETGSAQLRRWPGAAAAPGVSFGRAGRRPQKLGVPSCAVGPAQLPLQAFLSDVRGAALRNWECPAAPLARRSCRSRRFFRTCGAPPSETGSAQLRRWPGAAAAPGVSFGRAGRRPQKLGVPSCAVGPAQLPLQAFLSDVRGAALRNWECPAAPLARRSCRSRRFFRTCGAPPSETGSAQLRRWPGAAAAPGVSFGRAGRRPQKLGVPSCAVGPAQLPLQAFLSDVRGAALRNWECPAAPLARRSCRSRRFFRTCGAPPSETGSAQLRRWPGAAAAPGVSFGRAGRRPQKLGVPSCAVGPAQLPLQAFLSDVRGAALRNWECPAAPLARRSCRSRRFFRTCGAPPSETGSAQLRRWPGAAAAPGVSFGRAGRRPQKLGVPSCAVGPAQLPLQAFLSDVRGAALRNWECPAAPLARRSCRSRRFFRTCGAPPSETGSAQLRRWPGAAAAPGVSFGRAGRRPQKLGVPSCAVGPAQLPLQAFLSDVRGAALRNWECPAAPLARRSCRSRRFFRTCGAPPSETGSAQLRRWPGAAAAPGVSFGRAGRRPQKLGVPSCAVGPAQLPLQAFLSDVRGAALRNWECPAAPLARRSCRSRRFFRTCGAPPSETGSAQLRRWPGAAAAPGVSFGRAGRRPQKLGVPSCAVGPAQLPLQAFLSDVRGAALRNWECPAAPLARRSCRSRRFFRTCGAPPSETGSAQLRRWPGAAAAPGVSFGRAGRRPQKLGVPSCAVGPAQLPLQAFLSDVRGAALRNWECPAAPLARRSCRSRRFFRTCGAPPSETGSAQLRRWPGAAAAPGVSFGRAGRRPQKLGVPSCAVGPAQLPLQAFLSDVRGAALRNWECPAAPLARRSCRSRRFFRTCGAPPSETGSAQLRRWPGAAAAPGVSFGRAGRRPQKLGVPSCAVGPAQLPLQAFLSDVRGAALRNWECPAAPLARRSCRSRRFFRTCGAPPSETGSV